MIKVKVRIDTSKLEQTLRERHKAEVPKAAERLLQTLKDSTPVDTGNARDSWTLVRQGDTTTIQNDAEYISKLNAGSSQQAPAFFIEKAVMETDGVVPDGTIVTYK